MTGFMPRKKFLPVPALSAPACDCQRPRQKEPSQAQLDGMNDAQMWEYYTSVVEKASGASGNKSLATHYAGVQKRLRDYMLLRYMEDAKRIARAYFTKYVPAYSLAQREDLEQAVCLALIEVFHAYNPEFGVTFWQFANARGRSRIYGSIFDCLRKLQHYPRDIAPLRRRVYPLIEHLRQRLCHEPTMEEFCDFYGEKYAALVTNPLLRTSVFNQQSVSDTGDGRELMDWSASVEDHRGQERFSVTREWVELSTLILNALSDKDVRNVIYSYYYLGRTNSTIAESMQCSVSSVHNKHHEGLAILRKRFTLEQFKELIG